MQRFKPSVHLSGEPGLLMVPADAPAGVVTDTRGALGFDRPLWEQFAHYVSGAARGDLGTDEVGRDVLSRLTYGARISLRRSMY